uniref:Aquaporin n=1 Tax=Dugesia japonica TaxID=6161 RepID=A0A0G4DC26_DUGJA|nr:aquaporin [Dugesia japonica]
MMSESKCNFLVKLRIWSSLQDITTRNFWTALFAECCGTFILVFIGLGACYSNGGLVGAALAFGLGGSIGIYVSGPISGGNINPAVSIGLLIARQISFIRCMLYMLFQVIGALLAAKCISIMTYETFNKTHGISHPSVPWDKALFCEIVISFILVFTVMRMCVEKSRSEVERGLAALLIGISIVVGILCGGNISGGSMNPARTLGPAIVNNKLNNVWIYIAGPLIGGILAGLVQQLLFTSELSKDYLFDYLTNPKFNMEEEYKKYEERKRYEEFKKMEERKKYEEFKKYQECKNYAESLEAKADSVKTSRSEEKVKLTDMAELC